MAFSGFTISKIFLLVIEYKKASLSWPNLHSSFVQLHLVNPPKISLLLDLTTVKVAPLLLHFFLKSLQDLPSKLEQYNNSIFFILIFFCKDDMIKTESYFPFIILEFLKQSVNPIAFLFSLFLY